MNIKELIHDLRARINPQYYDQVGTESYERNQCVMALEYLQQENDRQRFDILAMNQSLDLLREENERLREDAERYRWQPIETAPKDGTDILVMTGETMHVVRWINIHGDFDYWAVDDNKHGPFTLRGKAPTHWMPLPETPK